MDDHTQIEQKQREMTRATALLAAAGAVGGAALGIAGARKGGRGAKAAAVVCGIGAAVCGAAAVKSAMPKQEDAVWNFYAPVYDLFMRQNRAAYEEMYARIRAAIAGKRVLEVCTGTGLIAKHVASAAAGMTATDFADKMLREAEKGEVPANLRFQKADATSLPFAEDSFDAVIICNALHILPEPERALAELRRVLRPGGILIAPNFVHADGDLKSGAVSKLLSAAGITFEAKWDAAGYAAFLEQDGWQVRRQDVLKAAIPLAYTECSDIGESETEIPQNTHTRSRSKTPTVSSAGRPASTTA